MQAWRARARLRRRARRRYLGLVRQRWHQAGAPRVYGRPGQLLLTLGWLAVPGVLAVVGMLALSQARTEMAPPLAGPIVLLVAAPVLVLWLLRGLTRL